MAGTPNWKNRTLCHGDNLDFLRSMNSETVDLIATDPPFNKGRDFYATPDSVAKDASFQDRWSWDDDVDGAWVDKLEDDFPEVMNVIDGSTNSYGYDMGAFLCFMAVRVLEMHRILKDIGSMYLHCDPTASHYLKELMDAVFGRHNFKNEIIWCYTGPSNTKRWFPRKHDTILFYAKSDNFQFNGDAVRIPYTRISGTGHNSLSRGNRTNEEVKALESQYAERGKIPEDYWTDIAGGGHISKTERTGYPTQKPLALYERIIKASSIEGAIVLDPFCGCATTCVAAEKLDRQWIGIDIWDKAHKTVIDRLKKEGFLAGPKDYRQDILITRGEISYVKKPFKRTDEGSEAVPFLPTKMKQYDDSSKRDPYSNKEKKTMLLEQHGPYCQGCGIELDERYFELDHKEPRSAGGSNLIQNRILLCGPCNKMKRDLYTIVWLRKENKKLGYMKNEKALTALK